MSFTFFQRIEYTWNWKETTLSLTLCLLGQKYDCFFGVPILVEIGIFFVFNQKAFSLLLHSKIFKLSIQLYQNSLESKTFLFLLKYLRYHEVIWNQNLFQERFLNIWLLYWPRLSITSVIPSFQASLTQLGHSLCFFHHCLIHSVWK